MQCVWQVIGIGHLPYLLLAVGPLVGQQYVCSLTCISDVRIGDVHIGRGVNIGRSRFEYLIKLFIFRF